MSTQILMPALSPTMTEGNLARWLKKEGDSVNAGDVIAEIETDKATMEVEAVDEGVLQKILIPAGTQGVAVNTPIAILLGEGTVVTPAASNNNTVSAATDIVQENASGDNYDILYAQGVVFAPPAFDEAKFLAKTKPQTVREALRDAMAEEMRRDERVYLMGE